MKNTKRRKSEISLPSNIPGFWTPMEVYRKMQRMNKKLKANGRKSGLSLEEVFEILKQEGCI